MPMLRLYTSSPATLKLAELGIRGHLAQRVLVLPISALPPPLPARAASLRLEQAALRQIERTLRWTLSQYATHRRLPDPTREDDLRADLDITLWQLHQVEASLRTLAMGASHPGAPPRTWWLARLSGAALLAALAAALSGT